MGTKNRCRNLVRPVVAVLLVGLISTAVFGSDGGAAKLNPVGGEFQVNSYTTLRQVYPAVAVDADGDFVVVWESEGFAGADSAESSIQGQRYSSDGAALGGQFQVNTYTSSYQSGPAVAIHADGDFVVVWASAAEMDGSRSSIQGQRYAADGSALGGEFQVNTYTTYGQFAPAVAVDAEGDFVVVWASYGSASTDTSHFSVQGRRYASDGSVLGGQFQVNTYTTDSQTVPSVAVDGGGNFVVVWQSRGSPGPDTSYFSIQGQRYAADGSALGGEFQVNSYTRAGQFRPKIAVDGDGDFVVVWSSAASAGTDSAQTSIQARRFASDGSALGGDFQVNTYTTSFQPNASVATDVDGNFVVVWQSNGSGGTDLSAWSIQGQEYSADGSAPGGELQVNTYTTSDQSFPAVAVGGNGDAVVVWHSTGSGGTDNSESSIQGQRFKLTQSCVPDAETLCLNDRRFRVEVDWQDFSGNTGQALVVDLDSADSGLFWFFAPDNWEMLVKVLDGCSITNHFWVFAAATTNVEYTLRVTDTETGTMAEYFNPLGISADAVADTRALATCP